MPALEIRMRIVVTFEKNEQVRFLSHLDIQRTFQRAFRRAELPISWSQGFNPHPLVSFASALPVGYTSIAEKFDLKLENEITPESFISSLNSVLPEGIKVTDAVIVEADLPALTVLMDAAGYDAVFEFEPPIDTQTLKAEIEGLLSGEIIVSRHSKKGGSKLVDIRPMVYDIEIKHLAPYKATLYIKGLCSANGSLDVGALCARLLENLGADADIRINRTGIFSEKGIIFPEG